MKQLLFAGAFAMAVLAGNAQPITTPQPSPTQIIKQNFGIGNIELNYSRPGAKGRTVMGDLVPYGKVWRTGANSATTITFSDDVVIGGKDIKAGKYGLLSIPDAKSWTIIITKDVNVNQPSLYKPENDVVRVTAPVMKIADKVETFTMQFANVTGNGCDLHLMWENTAVSLPITANTDAKVMAQIDNAFNKDNKPYFAAAQYYYDNGKDLAKAKMWVDKALETNESAFWMHLLKARILAKSGDKAGARASAQKTVELATKAENGDYVKMANDLIKTL